MVRTKDKEKLQQLRMSHILLTLVMVKFHHDAFVLQLYVFVQSHEVEKLGLNLMLVQYERLKSQDESPQCFEGRYSEPMEARHNGEE